METVTVKQNQQTHRVQGDNEMAQILAGVGHIGDRRQMTFGCLGRRVSVMTRERKGTVIKEGHGKGSGGWHVEKERWHGRPW